MSNGIMGRLFKFKKNQDEDQTEPKSETKNEGWIGKLKSGLADTSSSLRQNINTILTQKKLGEDTIQNLEDILIQADLGVQTATKITDKLAEKKMDKEISDEEILSVMANEIETTLAPVAKELELNLKKIPHVILVVGVNGSGKTTTIGKLAHKLKQGGCSITLVAGDTFRAAAVEQLKVWGERTGSEVIASETGADAAGLAFDAHKKCVEQGADVMIMDTAGRLQNKKELMDELEKIVRVLKKQDPDAPHTVLLTLDATTGNNALNQVEVFGDVAKVNGIVMTKLDGTARGGIIVAIADKYKLPVFFVGVGENTEDLQPFDPREFANAIVGINERVG